MENCLLFKLNMFFYFILYLSSSRSIIYVHGCTRLLANTHLDNTVQKVLDISANFHSHSSLTFKYTHFSIGFTKLNWPSFVFGKKEKGSKISISLDPTNDYSQAKAETKKNQENSTIAFDIDDSRA